MTWRQDDRADRERYDRCSSAPSENPAAKLGPDSGRAGASDESLYSLLGAPPDASASQLRKAWLQLLVTAHPDKGGCPDRFMALQQAYAVLSDAAQRAAYDDKLSREGGGSSASMAACGTYGGGNSSGRVVRSSGGVTVVVHGQTGPDSTVPKPTCHTSTTAAAAGAAAADSDNEEVPKLTALLEASQQQMQQGQQPSNSGGGSSSTAVVSQRLAELYLQRAQAMWQTGRLHHAAFDAQEALQLRPGWEAAQELLAKLKAAVLAATDAEAPAGNGLEDTSSDEGNW